MRLRTSNNLTMKNIAIELGEREPLPKGKIPDINYYCFFYPKY